MKMAYKIFNLGIPEEMAVKNPMNKNGRRIQEQKNPPSGIGYMSIIPYKTR